MKFVQLDVRPQGAVENDKVLNSGRVLGIEVTVPTLATRCVMGNLDHHGQDDTAETPSACLQALRWTTKNNVWPEVLATVRPDADSVTAMAVIHNLYNAWGIDPSIVADVDQFDRLGPSAGRPSALVTAIARKACDYKISLEQRVMWVAEIMSGADKRQEIEELNSASLAELEAARKASELAFHADGRIVTVVSTHRFATTLGYENALVVVAQNPSMVVDPKDPSKGVYNKYTVCRYDSHVKCDLPTALKELQALEAGWGGRGDIFGSPQGVSSVLTLEQVVEVVSRYLK